MDEGFCSEKGDGNFKDPDTCFGYITCTKGKIHRTQCPKGLMYNEEDDKCDLKENTRCDIPSGERGTRHFFSWMPSLLPTACYIEKE